MKFSRIEKPNFISQKTNFVGCSVFPVYQIIIGIFVSGEVMAPKIQTTTFVDFISI